MHVEMPFETVVAWLAYGQRCLMSRLGRDISDNQLSAVSELRSTLFLHGVCMLRECIYGECAHEST